MSMNAKEMLGDMKTYGAHLMKAKPDMVKALAMDLKKATLGDGVLDHKTKELMALSIAVHTRCEHCIAHHAQECIAAGATDEEMIEACGVAIMMGGGPAMTATTATLKVIEELRAGA